MNTLCLVLDRLHAGYLGAYGNSWIETPELDRLASAAFVFDQCRTDSPCLKHLYRSYWQGWHAACPEPEQSQEMALPSLLAQSGLHTALLGDDLDVLRFPPARSFAEQVEFDWTSTGTPAASIEETQMAGAFAQLIDWLQQRPANPFFAWCHLAGLGREWDAPREFRERYRDEEDPEPDESSQVPCRRLPQDYDPDEVLAATQAYAGQVTIVDACFGALWESMEEAGLAENTLVALLAPRGIPLGEHGRLGPVDDAIYSPVPHVPLVLRFPDGLGAAARSQALVEPADVWATLLEWHNVAPPARPTAKSLMPLVRGDADSLRDRLLVVGAGEWGLRTPAWYLRHCGPDELYAKPDDRWEVNDVAQRCQELVDLLRQTGVDYQRALQAESPVAPSPLPDELLVRM